MDWYSFYFLLTTILLIRRWLYTYLRFNRILLSHWLQCSCRFFFSFHQCRMPFSLHFMLRSHWILDTEFMYFAISSHIDWNFFFLIQSHGRQVDHKIHISKSKCAVELLSYSRYFSLISFWVGIHSMPLIEEREKRDSPKEEKTKWEWKHKFQ